MKIHEFVFESKVPYILFFAQIPKIPLAFLYLHYKNKQKQNFVNAKLLVYSESLSTNKWLM